MKIKGKITQSDIDEGLAGNCFNCPVARALARAAGSPCFINIAVFSYLGVLYETPQILRNFIMAFDAGGEVEPFEFEFDAVAVL